MRVTAHDPDRPVAEQPQAHSLAFTPFRVVPLGPSRELRIDLAQSATSRSISARLFRAKRRGRPVDPGRPIHLFPDQLPAVIAALTEAAAALSALGPIEPQAEAVPATTEAD